MQTWARSILTLVFLSLVSTAALATEIWFEDSNLGKSGGMPPDFIDKFRHPESFSQASRYIKVYLVQAPTFDHLDDQFLTTHFGPYLKRHNIKLALDAGGATWAQRPARKKVTEEEINLLKRLKKLGVEVHYVSLQSVLSKPLKVGGQDVDYPMGKRVEDVVSYSKAVRGVYPQAAIGIIDALPSHGDDYRQPYRMVKDALAREGIALAYVHLDMPFEFPHNRRQGLDWTKIGEIQRYVARDLGAKFGLITTSVRGGRTSNKAFHDTLMAELECYTGADGFPDAFVISSWFPYPNTTVPETGADYPSMRTVLEFGRRLEQIEQGGAAQAAQRAHSSAWQAMCYAGERPAAKPKLQPHRRAF